MQEDQPVLRVLESRIEDGTLVVSVQGEIDLATVDTLAAHLDHICERADAVTVDLRRVSFLDCLGLRQLLCLHDEGLACGCRVALHPGPACRAARVRDDRRDRDALVLRRHAAARRLDRLSAA